MRESLIYSSIRSLFIAFFAVVGIGFGFIFLLVLIGAISPSSGDEKLTTVNAEEILPNADGKREVLSKDTPVILQINIDGIIGTDSLNMRTVRQQLIESREGDLKKDRVKAILLFIDTPGGTVIDADGIYRHLVEYKKKYNVPIYAFIDGLCASGGMYIASAADKIYATDSSIIGSVGVLAPSFFNLSKTLDKLGIDTLTITAGKDKDAMNPLRPWKQGEDANYREIVDFYYQYFIKIVTENRREISPEKLIKDYGAQVFPAPEALTRGFVDVSGAPLSLVIKDLLATAKIEGDKYQVIRLESKEWWKTLFGGSEVSSLFKGVIKHQVRLSGDLDPALEGKFLYLYRP